jgi:hypothetical protein
VIRVASGSWLQGGNADGAGGGSATLDSGPERAARSLPASCPGNLAPRKVPPGEDQAWADRLGQVRDRRRLGVPGPPEGLHKQILHPGNEAVQLYHSGHTVHWIQALHTANKPEVAVRTRWGVIQSINGEVVEVRFDDGDVVRYRNHDSTMLDPSRTPTKAVFPFGPSRSGKSTWLRLMAAR